jgi:hypothetical protein
MKETLTSAGTVRSAVRRRRASCLVLAATLALPALARADDGEDINRFQINVGYFFITRASTTAAVAKKQGNLNVGTSVNWDADLGVEDRKSVPRIDGFYRFGKHSRIDFGYFDVQRNGTATTTFDINFDDIFIPAGTPVTNAFIHETTYKVDYGYSFYNTRRVELGLAAGLHWTDMSLGITAPSIGESSTVQSPVPLPVAGGYLRYDFGENLRWRYIAKVDIFALSYHEFSGSLSDIQLNLEYQVWKRAGFGFGFNRIATNFQGDSQTLRGNFDDTTTGYQLYFFGTFGKMKF